jgi:hypothetical protein
MLLAQVPIETGNAPFCRLSGLIDPATGLIFALRGEIHIEDEHGRTLAHTEGVMRLDYGAMVAGKA